MGRFLMAAGALAGASAVAMAAASAHALPQRLDARGLAAVQSAVQMQGWHALALVITGFWVMRAPPLSHLLGSIAGAGFLLGTILFCGAVYAHNLGGVSIGPVAPTGGLLLMLAWLCLGASAIAIGPTP